MAFMKEFMWDGGIVHLDFVPPMPSKMVEMDEKLAHVVETQPQFCLSGHV